MGEFIAICALIMFSVNVIITKVASTRLDLNTGFLISIAVNVLFSGFVLITLLLTRGQPLQFHALGFFMFVLSGLFASYLGRYLYFDSIAKLGPAKASTFMVSNPLFTVVFSWLFLNERLQALELAAMLVVLVGLFVVSYVPAANRKSESRELGSRISWKGLNGLSRLSRLSGLANPGVMLALMGSISYALGNITRGSAILDWNEPVLGGFLGALTGLVLQLLLNKKTRSFLSDLRVADKRGIWLYAISGVLTISAQVGHIAAMHYIPVSIATMITNSQPLLVIPLSYFLLKNQEGINLRTICGSLLVLVGIGTITLV
ncbi:DMT family transporter [Paenibacillus agricola]|uniref:DMT family transporter n=1 Tax=Paenibacillus agricola TaxID=2716264 RepID=A0ABX0JB22_9BACL|nr:DMT family transporter [Paenibacillus agricola]NHN33614.1 DMT family transporter [Paenibacillus agricola]